VQRTGSGSCRGCVRAGYGEGKVEAQTEPWTAVEQAATPQDVPGKAAALWALGCLLSKGPALHRQLYA